uniref:Tetratricopeptide repeat protein 41 n=1 Tax=Castor canadensis TaxID=51338 RepID=A0A8B7TLX7_CASCN|nr:putative tetratricopeptide repeat protein 41 [Castor canadensis]
MSSPHKGKTNPKANNTAERCNTQFILKHHKPIRPYICSTLKDFQEERDFLANHIFPQLNELCNSRGTYFKPVDLRWSAVRAQKPLPTNLFRQYSCLQSQHLKLCLDCVNHCFPFFICLLGQTYGDFILDSSHSLFSKAMDLASLSKAEQNLYVAAKNGYPWVLETPSCSLTEFEIIQATFRKGSQFQYFYFRTGTMLLRAIDEEKEERLSSGPLLNEEEKLRVGKLKAKIISTGLPVRFYKDLPELGELVLKDWSAVIQKLYPDTIITENRDYKHNFECFYHEEFTEKCKQVFVISKESNRIFEILEKFALKDVGLDCSNAAKGSSLDSVLRINSLPAYKPILLLSGERGRGKSTLIASWVNYFKNKHPNTLMIPYFVGSTCESSDIMSVIHYFITELQHENHGTQLEMEFLNEDSNVLVFPLLIEVFMASISLKPCILVLDGIEELIGIYGISGQKAKDFSWLPHTLPPHCKFILSTVSSSLSCKSLCARTDVRTLEFTNLGDKDTKLSVFRQYLPTPNQGPFWQSRHTLKKKSSPSPLKLTILANELSECRIYRNEFQCMKEYLEVTSIQELWELILKRWIEDYSWTFKQTKANSDIVASGQGMDGWVADVLCLLCISHCGLAEDELLQLLDMLGYRNHHKVTAVHWTAFRNATKHWVQEKPNGLLYFQHQSLRSTVEHKLLVLECRLFQMTDTDKCRLIMFIASFLKLMGKTNEAEELFLSVEDMLTENQASRGMLLKAQNAIGELYLEIGMAQEGFKYFQKAWSNLLCFSLSDLKVSQELTKQKVKVLNNLAKSASEEFLKENHILDYAMEVSKLVNNNPHDQATMKFTEGVLMLVAGNSSLAKMKFQECLNIRRSLFGEKNMLVGEIMEFLADLLFFLPRDNEKSQKKQVTEYYKQVINIKENADTLARSSLVKKQLSISLSDTLCKLAGQILASDSCHHAMIEAVGYLYKSLHIRGTHLGSSHSSIQGILHLLREIEQIRGRRWPQGMSQQSPEGSKKGSSLRGLLPKLNYHSAQGTNTVNSALCVHSSKLHRAQSIELAAHPILDKSKYASSKGKVILRPVSCISAEEKPQRKAQNNVETWTGPRKEAPKKKKGCPFNIMSSDKMNGLVRVSRQRILSARNESGEGQITIYSHPLLVPPSTDNPWEPISELISEKWLFHSPEYSLMPQKSVFQGSSQIEMKLVKTSNDISKE